MQVPIQSNFKFISCLRSIWDFSDNSLLAVEIKPNRSAKESMFRPLFLAGMVDGSPLAPGLRAHSALSVIVFSRQLESLKNTV
jgi:hypothetical protein